MGLFGGREKTREELLSEIEEECYGMAFGAGLPEAFMEYEDAKYAPEDEVKRIAEGFGISLHK